MLVLNTKRRVEIPHEDGEWMDLQTPSWKLLGKARDIQVAVSMEKAKSLGSEMLSAITGDRDSDEIREARKKAESENGDSAFDLSSFDLGTILGCIESWSYPEDVNTKNVGQLDEPTALWAGQAILDQARPESEEAAKNG